MQRVRLLTILLALALVGPGTGCSPGASLPRPTESDSWISVRTQRFEILSDMGEDEAREIASDLERFHALIRATTTGISDDAPIPTRIYAFRDEKDFSRFAPPKTAGVFIPGVRSNYVVLRGHSRGNRSSEIIFHEYVHFILRNGSLVSYPIWYDEGFAEFLSTARVQDDVVAIGSIPAARAGWLQFGEWMPTGRLVSGRTYEDFRGDDRAMLYAQSWALVHYLVLDRASRGGMSDDLGRHLSLLAAGVAPEAAFEEAFGESPDEAGRNIRRLLRGKGVQVVGLPLAKLEYDRSEPVVRAMPPHEVHLRLGELALRRRDAPRAEVEFRAALARDPGNARAHAGLGDALRDQEEWSEAAASFDRAVDLAPEDALNLLDRAEFHHSLTLRPDRIRDVPALLARARADYRRSLELDPSRVETVAMLAATHLAPGQDPAEALAPLERSLQRLPSARLIRLLLVETYVAVGREREARRILLSEAAAHGSGDVEEIADRRIEAFRALRAERAALWAEAGSKTLEVVSPGGTSEARGPER